MTDLPALPSGTQLPSYLAKLPETRIAETGRAGLAVQALPRISIAGQSFTFSDPSGAKMAWPQPFLDCVVVDVAEVMGRVFWGVDEHGYQKPFDPSAPTFERPICFSDNGIGASMNAQTPQATRCNGCKWDAWGSAISRRNNEKIPACSSNKKIAVYVHGVQLEGKPAAFQLIVPIMSRSNLDKYLASFVGHKIDVNRVWTRIRFEHGQMRLLFDTTYTHDNRYSYIDEGTATNVAWIMAEKMTDELVGRTDQVWGGTGPQITAGPAPSQLPPPPAAPPVPAAAAPPAAPPPAAPPPAPPATQAAPAAPEGQEKRGRGRPRKVPEEGAPASTIAKIVEAEAPTPPAGGFTMPAAPPQTAGNGARQAPFGIVNNPPAPDSGLTEALRKNFG